MAREYYPGISLKEFAKRRHGGTPYMSDASDLRALEDAEFDARHPAPAAPVIPKDPRIGMLNSGRYYAYPYGYSGALVEGSLEEVEAALAIVDMRPA